MNTRRSLLVIVISVCVYPAFAQTEDPSGDVFVHFSAIMGQSLNETAQVLIAPVRIPGFKINTEDEPVIQYRMTLKLTFDPGVACDAVEVTQGVAARFTIDSRPETDGSALLSVNGRDVCSVHVDEYSRITYEFTVTPSNTLQSLRTGEKTPLPAAARFVSNLAIFDSATGETISTVCFHLCGTSFAAPSVQ